MKRLAIITISSLLLFSCESGDKARTSDSDSAKTDTGTVKAAAPKSDSADVKGDSASNTAWKYSDKDDKMTSKKKYYAEIDANETLDFKFPYDGGSTATLTIRNSDTGNEAMLSVSKGQFITGVDGTTIKIRFDNEQAATFNASSSSDGSSDLIFIENAKKLVKKIKTAKQIIIQAEFYDAGLREMTFNVAGFTWEH
jgi:hypothetical protein